MKEDLDICTRRMSSNSSDKRRRRRSDSFLEVSGKNNFDDSNQFLSGDSAKSSPTEKSHFKFFNLGTTGLISNKIARSPIERKNNRTTSLETHYPPRPEEKEKLLKLLGNFFSMDGNDYRYDDLFDDYEWAVESGCLESYELLLKSLYKSTLTFEQFSVCSDDDQGKNMLYVQFHDSKVNGDICMNYML